MLVYPSKIVQCGCLQIVLIFISIFKSSGDGVVMNLLTQRISVLLIKRITGSYPG